MTPTTVALMGLAYAVAQFLGKVIPDSATGVLAGVRKLAKMVSLYTTNKE